MDLKPLSDRVVVRRVDSNTVTSGGIFIPDAAVEKADRGTVLAVGPGRRTKDGVLIEPGVAVNDTVLFTKGGHTINVNGEELLVLKEETDILAVINQGE